VYGEPRAPSGWGSSVLLWHEKSPMTDPVIASALNLAARAIEKAPSCSKFAIPSSAHATASPSMMQERRCCLATGL
jgi:hypothetical protein